MGRETHWDGLLAEADWLHTLASGLVRDTHAANDLVQEAWVAALRQGQPPGRSPRAWIRGTMRKLALKAARSTGRRAQHEGRAARAGQAPSAEELTLRAEAHEVLLAAVRALPEAYRVPLLLRYYDDRSPIEIAEELSLPVRTVHTRLQRALQKLRERLDGEHGGDRGRWVGALFPGGLVSAPAGREVAESTIAASRSVITVLGWAAGAVVVAFVLLGAWKAYGEEGPIARSVAGTDEGPTESPPDSRTPATTGSQPSQGVRTSSSLAALEPGGTLSKAVHGEVVDWGGRPVANALIEATPYYGSRVRLNRSRVNEFIEGRSETIEGRSDASGRFSAPVPEETTLFRASTPGAVTVLAAAWRPTRPDDSLRVVLAPATSLRSSVADSEGVPLRGVSVEAFLADVVEARFDWALERQHLTSWRVESGAQGQFELKGLPDIAELRLALSAPGFRTLEVSLAEARAGALALSPNAGEAFVGYVVGSDGRGLGGAVVAMGDEHALADEYGSFVLQGEFAADSTLWVVHGGYRPTGIALAEVDRSLELPVVLTEAPLRLRGTVVDASERPMPDVEVWLANPTAVGARDDFVVLEAIADGGEGFPTIGRTDSSGRFELGGLDDRAYALRALDPRTGLWVETAPFAPGDDAAIVLPTDELIARLSGRLTTPDGLPVAGARVCVQAPAFGVRANNSEAGHVFFAHGAESTTDGDGRFELAGVPRAGAQLAVTHPEMISELLPVPGEGAPLEWTLARRCHLRVTLDDARWAATAVRLLDAEGRTLTLRRVRAFYEKATTELTLERGRSPVVVAPEDGVELLILSGDREVARLPLRLIPGELVTVEH